MYPLIIHIPHASTVISLEVTPSFLLSKDELNQEILRMTDWFTDELFYREPDAAVTVAAPVSRLVVDVERFRDDAEEVMASCGMGAIYVRASDGQPLRTTPSRAEREAWLERWYDPHHALLTSAVRQALEQARCALIIDGHSFPSSPLPYELDQAAHRPDICLGSDSFHTPPSLCDFVQDYFVRLGLTVQKDRPFSGAIAPALFFQREPRVVSLMIEINRRLYLDEESGDKNEGFRETRDAVSGLLVQLARSPWAG